MRFRSAAWVGGVLLLSQTMAWSDGGAGWARHKKIYVVPAPAKLTIDGKLDDWDLSGQTQMYVYRETADMQSARIAMMYDGEAFYVSGVVRDPSPMMNRHDPKVDADKAWDADVCQLFLNLNPALGYPLTLTQNQDNKGTDKDLTILYLWHYTDRQESCLAVLKGLPPRPDTRYPARGAVPAGRFEGAYMKAGDGGGYTFEYRIPWSTLGATRPLKAGDLTAGTVFALWSTPDGLKTAGGSAWAYDVMAFPGFAYQNSACWGKFIFAEKGGLASELVEEGLPPEPPLPLKFSYDLPEDGVATLQLVETNGMVARLLVAQGERKAGKNVELWDGLDDNGSPLRPGTYIVRGLHHKGIKTKFCFSAHNSGQPPYKTDDNTGGWGGDHGNPTAVCAAGDDMVLTWALCESGWGIIRTDAEGKKRWGIRHNATDVASDGERVFVAGDHGYEGADSVKPFDLAVGRPLNWGNGKPALEPPPGSNACTATGVAYADGAVYVAWGARNAVGIYDAGSGKLKKTVAVSAPRRLAAMAGRIAVISGSRVEVVDTGRKAQSMVIDQHLDAPVGIACDTNGNVYVANAGRLQNVSVFDKDGKYLRSIGKEGGRPVRGLFDRNGMYEPGGIALDKQGRLWVAETTDGPKRHSVWDPKTGLCVRDFYGASSYFGWAAMDPKKPDELYCHNVLWKIDWTNNTCAPYSTIWRATAPNEVFEANPAGYAGHFRVFTAKNGKQFGWGMYDYSPMLYMREGDLFKPIAGSIRVSGGPRDSNVPYPAMAGFHAKNKGYIYLWQDANNDQAVQENELSVSPGAPGEIMFNWIDDDLNAWCDAGLILKPVRFADDGRPIYDFTQKNPIPFQGNNANCCSLWLDPADPQAVYTLVGGGDPGLARRKPDGTLVWGFRGTRKWHDSLNLAMGTPGKLYGLTMPLGVAGDFTGVACYACPYYLFTKDGLYVSMIMRNGRDGRLGADITASETLTGQLVKPDGMNRYFLLAGDQDGRVTEVLGLDTVKRLPEGAFTLTEADAKLAAESLRDYRAKLARLQKLSIARGRSGLAMAQGVGKGIEGGRSFSARAAYDDKNLYVQFDVGGSDLVNAFSDANLVFKGGNCLDIQFATDPSADPKRKTPAPGDVRILITRQATASNTVLAMVYRPKVKGFTGQPIVMTSPTGKEPFDQIERSDAVTLEYRKENASFKATVTVPLALLGWTPRPAGTVRMDLGYIFGNANGSQAAARAYWSNNGFSANVVNDVPNESRLEPSEWGEAGVE